MKADGLIDDADIYKYLNRLAYMLFYLTRYEERRTC